MMRILHLVLFMFTVSCISQAQEILFDRNGQILTTIERLSVKSGTQPLFHQGLNKFDRKELIHHLLKLKEQDLEMHPLDREDLELVLAEQYFPGLWPDSLSIPMQTRHSGNEGNKWLRHFYRTKTDFLALQRDDLYLKVNPVANFALGRDKENRLTTFRNTRGLILEGSIGKHLYFYSSVYENQASFPEYIDQKIREEKAIPGNGFYKSYSSTVLPNLQGYDYTNSQAYVSVRIHKNISTQLGHGRYFIGQGIRSLLLSDLSQNYFFLALNTNIWKLHYHNLFAELTSTSPEATPGDVLNTKKYMASHYLSYRITPRLEAAFFESVIFSRGQHFEFQYLNPVILYRSVEQFLGSPDNVLMGLDINYSFLKRYKLYGQLILDEFSLRHIRENEGWWGNKYGLQAGIKAFDLGGISHLDVQLEGNFVRPFTYSHQDSSTNYTHYRQLLAHPLGSSFYEGIFSLKYRPATRIFLEGTALYARHGGDLNGENRGSHVFRSSNDRLSETGYFTADGDTKKYWIYRLKFSYRLFPGYFAEIRGLFRQKRSMSDTVTENTVFADISLRVNFHQTYTDY